MRDVQWVLVAVSCGVASMGAGCGSNDHHAAADAAVGDATPIDAPVVIDAPPDAPACENTLLVGGMDAAAQGFTVYMIQPATITYGADYTQLTTSTVANASSGGQLLLARPATFATDQPFKLQVVMQVVAVSPHGTNTLDAPAAIMGSLNGQVGNTTDRSEMVYFDPAKVGWADDSQTAPDTPVDGNYHTYVLAVATDRTATLSIDGVVTLTRPGFVTNGTIAVGDQTNDGKYDGTMRIRSVKQLCVD